MDSLAVFCRQIRARSAEHRSALALLHRHDLSGQVVSILRQEVDSMVRVIYLLAQGDRSYRTQLIKASVDGTLWTAQGKARRVTDREMVELAQTLHGWTASVYRFGCAFIHLSQHHDYRDRDPMDAIDEDEHRAILDHLRYYHGGPASNDAGFQDIVRFLPMVFEKIADNLECYVKELENDGDLH